MDASLLYLRPNVQVEPLFDQWYAWSHLIPPATAARNLTERHLKIMDSYISNPQVHANAVMNPKLLGGPVIDYGGKRVDEIKVLRDQTKRLRGKLIELSKAIASLEEILRTRAHGSSLEPLYCRVPEVLKGYIELTYDLNNNPSFRIIEPLLYKSPYYDRSAQSLALSLVSGDHRPFVLSTPRLESGSIFQFRVPFDDDRIDELFRMKSSNRTWGEIKDILSVPEESERLARAFFTPDAPVPGHPYNGRGLRWRYFGHACVLVETPGCNLLFDPFVSYSYKSDTPRYTYLDLPDSIDFVVITHGHQDHLLFETLLQIKHKVRNFVIPSGSGGLLQDPSMRLILRHLGCQNVIELGEMESIEWGGVSITALPFLGEHSDLGINSKAGYLVRAGKRQLMFAADSCNVEPALYKHLHQEIGDVDALFLGMECDGAPLSWLYGPLLTRSIERAADQSRRLSGSNFEQAFDLVRHLNSRSVYVYAMGLEPWLTHIMSLQYTEHSRPMIESNRLISECTSRGIHAERLFGKNEFLLGD